MPPFTLSSLDLVDRQFSGASVPEQYTDDKSSLVLGVIISNISLTSISLALRLWARRSRRLALHWDDYCMILDMLVNLGIWILSIVSVRWGYGRHIFTLKPENYLNYLRSVYSTAVLYPISLSLVKLSILFLYMRIFIQPMFRRVAWTALAAVATFAILSFCIAANICIPFEHLWNPNVCFDSVKVIYGISVTNMLLDIAIFLLPIPLLKSLQVSKGKRVALIAIFLLGLCVCFISIARIIFIRDFSAFDVSYDSVTYGLLADYEIVFSVLCANFSIAYPLIAKNFQRAFSSLSSRKGSSAETRNAPPGAVESRHHTVQSELHELKDTNSEISTAQLCASKQRADGVSSRGRGDEESSVANGDDGSVGGGIKAQAESS
ncbi:MAG: hypothetical protein M1829_000228 [Trizodia sp. TS-e1964]|nr:MAG: hypothetical protein M1829_000228 [Trizodia sp. TS-e1964]